MYAVSVPTFDMTVMRVHRDEDPTSVEGFFTTVDWAVLLHEGEGLSISEELGAVTVDSVGFDLDGSPTCSRVASCSTISMLTHDALHPGEPLQLREALAAYSVEVDHVKVWQTVGKLRRRHRLMMSGEPREPGYRVEDWTWEARRLRSSVRQG